MPITADLPVRGHAAKPAPRRGRAGRWCRPARYDTTIAVMGGASRKGVWEMGETHTAFAIMAGIDLDLREARFTSARR